MVSCLELCLKFGQDSIVSTPDMPSRVDGGYPAACNGVLCFLSNILPCFVRVPSAEGCGGLGFGFFLINMKSLSPCTLGAVRKELFPYI